MSPCSEQDQLLSMLHTTTAVRIDKNAPANGLFTDHDSDTNSVRPNSIDNCTDAEFSLKICKTLYRIVYSKHDVYNGNVCASLKVLTADVIWLM